MTAGGAVARPGTGAPGGEDPGLQCRDVPGVADDGPGVVGLAVVAGQHHSGTGDDVEGGVPSWWRAMTACPARPGGTE
jgi:hypothetical protein